MGCCWIHPALASCSMSPGDTGNCSGRTRVQFDFTLAESQTQSMKNSGTHQQPVHLFFVWESVKWHSLVESRLECKSRSDIASASHPGGWRSSGRSARPSTRETGRPPHPAAYSSGTQTAPDSARHAGATGRARCDWLQRRPSLTACASPPPLSLVANGISLPASPPSRPALAPVG